MAADINEFPWMVIIVRALMGVCEGATFPSISAMMAKWAPQEERSRMSTFIYAGTIEAYSALSLLLIFIKGSQAGTIIAFPLAGVICNSLGWEWVFYIQVRLFQHTKIVLIVFPRKFLTDQSALEFMF